MLLLPVSQVFNYTFDPNVVLAVDDNFTLYQGDVQVTDQWGVLRAAQGVLFRREIGRIVSVQVPAPPGPAKSPFTGKGWTFELKSDWTLVPERRTGDFAIREKTKP